MSQQLSENEYHQDKNRYYIIKELILQEDVTILNTCALKESLNIQLVKVFLKFKEIDKSTIITLDFNSPFNKIENTPTKIQ